MKKAIWILIVTGVMGLILISQRGSEQGSVVKAPQASVMKTSMEMDEYSLSDEKSDFGPKAQRGVRLRVSLFFCPASPAFSCSASVIVRFLPPYCALSRRGIVCFGGIIYPILKKFYRSPELFPFLPFSLPLAIRTL